MIEELTCRERVNSLNEKIAVGDKRLDSHSARLASVEISITGLEKDHDRLKDILERLEGVVEGLAKLIEELRLKPLRRYEQISLFIVTAILGAVLGYVLGQVLGGL